MDIPPISGISLNPAELTTLSDVNPVSSSQLGALNNAHAVDIANLASDVEISAKAQGFAATIALLSQKIAVANTNVNANTINTTAAVTQANLPASITVLSSVITPSINTAINPASINNMHSEAITATDINVGNVAVIAEAQVPALHIYAAANPVLAAAVAAYRMGEGVEHKLVDKTAEKSFEAVNDIEAITGIQAVHLNLHEQSSHSGQDQTSTDTSKTRPAANDGDTGPTEAGAIDICV